MQCLMPMLTLAFVALSLSNCTHHVAVDSFCTVYNPVVTAKGDGSITATPGVKKRILANELTFREQCPR
jgi:hypothetical protein